MEKLVTTRIIGLELNTPEGAVSDTTEDTVDTAYGKAIGFSLSAPLSTDKLALIKITMEQSDFKPVSNASVDSFVPMAGRLFYRFAKPLKAAQKVTITLDSLTADSDAQKPIILNWHYNDNNEIED